MCDSLKERIADSPEAYDAAVMQAGNMVRALKRTYSDKMVKMAFEAALKESQEVLFQSIYEAACALREDTLESFVKFVKAIKYDIAGDDLALYGAAVFYRLNDMAEDNIITEPSWPMFRMNLIGNSITDSKLLSMGELYFYMVKYGASFEKLKLNSLSIQTKSMYDAYKALSPGRRAAYKKIVKDAWWKVNQEEEPKKRTKKLFGLFEPIPV